MVYGYLPNLKSSLLG